MTTTPAPVQITPVRKIVGISYPSAANDSGEQAFGIITTITADAVIEEAHDDQLVVTDHPVEQGSAISDHAYKLPAKLDLTFGWSAGSSQNTSNADPQSFLISLYNQLLGFQIGRILCSIYTGKRIYKNNMILQSLGVTTDKDTENVLMVRARFQEILMASTQAFSGAPQNANQANPQATNSPVSVGTVSLTPAPALNQP